MNKNRFTKFLDQAIKPEPSSPQKPAKLDGYTGKQPHPHKSTNTSANSRLLLCVSVTDKSFSHSTF